MWKHKFKNTTIISAFIRDTVIVNKPVNKLAVRVNELVSRSFCGGWEIFEFLLYITWCPALPDSSSAKQLIRGGLPKFFSLICLHARNPPLASSAKEHSIQNPNTYPKLSGRVSSVIPSDHVHHVSSVSGRSTFLFSCQRPSGCSSHVQCYCLIQKLHFCGPHQLELWVALYKCSITITILKKQQGQTKP